MARLVVALVYTCVLYALANVLMCTCVYITMYIRVPLVFLVYCFTNECGSCVVVVGGCLPCTYVNVICDMFVRWAVSVCIQWGEVFLVDFVSIGAYNYGGYIMMCVWVRERARERLCVCVCVCVCVRVSE